MHVWIKITLFVSITSAPIVWFGMVTGISWEFQILKYSNFCYKETAQHCEGWEREFHEDRCLFSTDLIIYSSFIIALLNSPASTSSNGSKGGCLSWAALEISVWKFGTTEILTSLELSFSSMLSNLRFNSLLYSLLLFSVDILVITLLICCITWKKLQDLTINKMGQTSCQSRLGFVRARCRCSGDDK